MKEFINRISLVKNSRGVYDLDTSKGCTSGILNNPKGCYNDCYAAKYSKRYGYNFSKTISRSFVNEQHLRLIIKQINNIEMPFIRIGVTGDPSENWDNTLNVINSISDCNMVLYKTYKKVIVIITKHWNNLTNSQLNKLSKFDICINTSISALDTKTLLNNRLSQYNILKKYCKSVLRIVSCDFNLNNKTGRNLNIIQEKLFNNENVLDTILRIDQKNEYVLNGIINIKSVKFLGKQCYASIYNKNTYFGKCSKCSEMCGINL